MERMLEQRRLHQELLIDLAPLPSRRNSKSFFGIGIAASPRPTGNRASLHLRVLRVDLFGRCLLQLP
jgi:hypothetical protein